MISTTSLYSELNSKLYTKRAKLAHLFSTQFPLNCIVKSDDHTLW